MVISYESCRIGKVKEGKIDKIMKFIEKNISKKGFVYKKNSKWGLDLRIFFIEKKEFNEGVDVKIAFDTPMNILDYIKYGEETRKIRHSILGRLILFTQGGNKGYIMISLKKTRSKKIIAEMNRLIGEDIIDFCNIDLPKAKAKNITNFWATGIKDDHERNISASGNELEEGNTYKTIEQKRGHFSAVKTKSKNLNYGLSEEGLIWVILKKDMNLVKFISETLIELRQKDVIYQI